MRNQHKPVLIFAQSGRFLAQSATQSGYRVWVADCFGDQEILSIAERWQQLDPFDSLTPNKILAILSELTQGEDCTLLCGSGIERFYPFLNELPKNIELVGNSVNTIHTLKTPQLFFTLLNQQNLPYPETLFQTPTDGENWLAKSGSGLGGTHIQYANKSSSQRTNRYFQQFITGTCGSVLFLADSVQSQIISINQQYLSPSPSTPFRLGKIDTPWLISTLHRQQLKLATDKITFNTGLLGLNSLDFIISNQGKLLILEVNPRPSASAELIDKEINLFQHHITACHRKLPLTAIIQPLMNTSLHYIYADHDTVISIDMTWPLECSDLPTEGTFIQKEAPICTVLLVHAENLLPHIEQAIKKQLPVLA